MNSEDTSAAVPATGKQAEEDLWQRYGSERRVWSESMLIALERGLKGNKWFSLIDKVVHLAAQHRLDSQTERISVGDCFLCPKCWRRWFVNVKLQPRAR